MTEEPIRVLLLDDDPDYCQALAAYLGAHGCEVRSVHDPAALVEALRGMSPDILLLDQYLGPVTGTDVLRRLRIENDLPCIIVSGRSDPTERIVNLELGADDEIDKALPPRELLARLRTVLRRARPRADPHPPAGAPRSGWILCPARRELHRPDGSLCHLTTAEFDALSLLHAAKGRVVSRAALCRQVFGRALRPGDRAVDTVIRKLRRKIQPGDGPDCIKTVRPTGYAFVGFADEPAA
jgi:DNA-binding response OmpR family regulator